MKLLLLGADGQLGTDISRATRRFDNEIELIPMTHRDFEVTQAEVAQRVLGEQEFDALINCTSYHKTDEVEDNAAYAIAINAWAVKTLAELCAQKRSRFIHISTDYVFDGLANDPYTEDASTGPLNVYGASKVMGEALARTQHDDVLIFRVASLFGVAGASGKGGNFVETMIRVGREKGQLRVVNDQVMSPTYTADVAEMILAALRQRVAPGIYHAVNSGQASWYEFACRIIERAGVEATVEPIPSSEFPQRAQRPAFSVLDNRKLTALIGDIPPWEDALDRYLKAKGHL